MKILLVDDDPGFRRALSLVLEDAGYQVSLAADAREGFERAGREAPDVILTDIRMPGDDGLALVSRLRGAGVGVPILVMTAYGSMDLAVDALRRGASDYLAKPFGSGDLLLALRKAEARQALALPPATEEGQTGAHAPAPGAAGDPRRFGALLAASPSLIRVGETAERVAPHPTTVLIEGPTGTGKELLARFLHDASPRAAEPFVPVNCGAIPAGLLESEFFGVRKGAYTGAERDRAGLFEAASGGTLFLDEVGELPLPLQAKLLRVLQEGVVRRVGDSGETAVDVRVVAATNRDLKGEVAAGAFREDLYYRLAVVTLVIPPLAERPEDLALLVDHLLARHGGRTLTPEARAYLMGRPWPGNVRELENVVERAVIVSEDAGAIGVEAVRDDAPPGVGEGFAEGVPGAPGGAGGLGGAGGAGGAGGPGGESGAGGAGGAGSVRGLEDLSVKRHAAALERELIAEALRRTEGHRGQAAELLELSDRALRYKIREYGIEGEGGEG